AYFSLVRGGSPAVRRHLARGGRAYLVADGTLIERNGASDPGTEIVAVRDIPIAIGGLARHNVANALAASGGARALGASIDDVHHGLHDFRPTAEHSPGRLNVYRVGARIVIVDFAHNEAGIDALLDVAEGIAGGAAGRAAPITTIIGTAGDRPDDTLRGIGRIAADRSQRVAVKETLRYLRGRTRESVVGELVAGAVEGGMIASDIPVYESETAALRAELNGAGATGPNGHGGRPDGPRVIALMCHEERDAVFTLLADLGARPVDVAAELGTLVPRLQDRPRA
ncbi:MAG TPA: cyanophycin synthetase, partial [Candidatus Binatia bacterium]|nr:cyanophycin synthetase [Candidatus Binatia bacterium]